jgi:hypothetical protein
VTAPVLRIGPNLPQGRRIVTVNILSVFTKFRKATISFIMFFRSSVRSSISVEQLRHTFDVPSHDKVKKSGGTRKAADNMAPARGMLDK